MANINKNIIMQAGAAVANAANKAAGLSAATPEPGSIISVIQLVNGGRTIGPDALAHFTESVRNKLLSLLVTLEPIQDFNGFDHPWPAGGGENLLFLSEYSGNFYNVAVGTSLASTSPYFTGTDTNSSPMRQTNTQGFGGAVYATGLLSPGEYYYSFRYGTIQESVRACSYVVSEDYKVIRRINVHLNTTSVSQSVTISEEEAGCRIAIIAGINAAATYDVYDLECHAGSTALQKWPPYTNVCPISGRTGLHVYAGPTSAIGDSATYSMAWTSPAGTVYAGSADIVSGDIKAAPYYASYNGETLVGPWVSSMDEYDPEGTPTTGAQVVDLGGTMTEYHITGQDIITLVGDNYIWSDSGDVTIT